MADRRCPNCGELVPSNSITCPKCFKKIPVEPEPIREERSSGSGKRRVPWTPNIKIAFILDIVLGFFGLLGVGQLYCGKRRGFVFLVLGLLFFVCGALLIWVIPPFSLILAMPFMILYVILYLGALADLFLGSADIRFSALSR
ncbi:MAG: hypothetical protein Q4Q62_00075 [Thermoplasmata archaeon]|nr:hypothetical protein [Thermoplasmata archaeon]